MGVLRVSGKVSDFAIIVARSLLCLMLLTGSAYAHSFGVILIIPQSAEKDDSGKDYRNGFMLATSQRDSHPNEESDGHLGGLDVYVSVVEAGEDVANRAINVIGETEIDIVLVYGMNQGGSDLRDILEDQNVVLVMSGEPPQENSAILRLAEFRADFEAMFGYFANENAILGYNGAQRIEQAVRQLGGVDDRAGLKQIFAQSARGFSW